MKKLIFALMLLGTKAYALPLTQDIRLFEDPETDESWNVIADDADPHVFYRFPDYFTILKDERGHMLAQSHYQADGSLALSFLWGMRDTMASDSRLKARIEREIGGPVVIYTLTPRLERIEFDTSLSSLHPKLDSHIRFPKYVVSSDAFRMELLIPKDQVEQFAKDVVTGSGYTLLMQFYYRIKDTQFSAQAIVFPYATSILLSGFEACIARPEFVCTET